MKSIKVCIASLALSCLFACTKPELPDLELPSSVDLGKSKLFLNGLQIDFSHQFVYDTINDQMIFVFEKSDILKNSKNTLSFTFLPHKDGKYIIHKDPILYKGALTLFSQVIAEDLEGWKFDLDRPEEGYFEILRLDKLNQTALIKFKVKFKLKSKNGNGDTGLPESLKFEGIYNELYNKG